MKLWLLALPHYLVISIFAGGSLSVGLIGLLVVIAAIVLLFTGRYPTSIYDLLMG